MKKQVLNFFVGAALYSLLSMILLIACFAPYSSSAQVPSYVPANGLIGWWPFNGNANDESGNGNNGVVNNSILTLDRYGNQNQAYDFNGLDNFIKVNQIFDFEERSVNAWFQSKELYQTGNSAYQILNIDSQTLQHGFTSSQIEGGILYLTGGGESVSYAIPIDSNRWYMITTTRNVNVVKYYLNGQYIAEAISGINTSTSNDNPNLLIGVDRAETVQFFKGKIDDLGIWNRELTACEIADLYNAQLGSLNTSSTQTESAIDSYTWSVNGQTYTQSGSYTSVIQNAAGCDSTITLNLTLGFTGIEDLQPNANKNLVRITDLNGEETPFQKNKVLFFIYEDGTIERLFEAE
jgi:hypothetical protein